MDSRHFACTACGACCNRAPEVELGEALALADVFVWTVLVRLYSLPRFVGDFPADGAPRDVAAARFFESKRLLGQFAAHSYAGKAAVGGAMQPRHFYLTLSALAFDPQTGACPALAGTACSIYARRPLSCRSVPLHYSRAAAFAAQDLDAFVAMPGHACAVAPDAPLVVQDGQITDPQLRTARADAVGQAAADAPWKAALVKAMKRGDPRLPTLTQVQREAARGAITAPFAGAIAIAEEAGILPATAQAAFRAGQNQALDRLAARPGLTLAAAQALAEQRRLLG